MCTKPWDTEPQASGRAGGAAVASPPGPFDLSVNQHLSLWTSLLSLLILHLAAKVVTLAPAPQWPSSSSTSRNCGFPLCSSLQVPKREDLTSAFLFKPKHTRHRSLGIIYGHSPGPGVQLVMVMVIWPTDKSVRSVDRDFTRKGCERASNNCYL